MTTVLRAALVPLLVLTVSLGLAPSTAQALPLLDGGASSNSEPPRGEWGRTRAPDQQRAASSCGRYRYHYRVEVPTDDWMAEFTLVNRNGRKVGFRSIDSNAQRADGRLIWRVCRVVPGRHTIRMKVTYEEGRDEHVGRGRTSHFAIGA